MSRSMKAHLLLLFVVFVWGSTFVLVKDALASVSPLLFTLMRMALAAACLVVVYRKHIRSIDRRTLGAGVLIGLFLSLGYQFQTVGLRLTTPSQSAFLTGTMVIFVPLLLIVPKLRPAGTKAPRWNAFLGTLLALAGIFLLTTPSGAGFGFHALHTIGLGDLLTLVCALGFALQTLAIAHASPRMKFEQLAVVQISFAAVFMAVTLPVFEHPHVRWNGTVIAALLITAVLATALAFTVQTWVQQILPATHVAVLFTLEPVFAWLVSWLALGQPFGLRSGGGALLILCGILLTELLSARTSVASHEAASVQTKGLDS